MKAQFFWKRSQIWLLILPSPDSFHMQVLVYYLDDECFYTDTKSVLNFAPSPRNLIQKLSETILPIPDSWNGHCM